MEKFYNKLIYNIEKFLNHKYWYITTAIVTVIAILFFVAPSYYPLAQNFHPCSDCVSFQEVINRADHLLTPSDYPEYSHMANTQLRITVPIIAKLIGTRSKIVIFGIQELFGILFLIITCLLSYRVTKDKVIAATVTLSIGFIYAGKAAFVDLQGLTDPFAFFFLILANFTRKKPLIFISLILAYFTDERALVSSSFIAIFYFLEFLETANGKIDFYAGIKARVFYVLLSWIGYFIIRYILYKQYGLYNPATGLILPDPNQFGYIFWDGLQGFWLMLFLGIIYLIIEKRFFVLSLLTLSFLVMVVSTSMVYDVTRSIAYIFPVIFIALLLLEKAMNKFQIRKVVILSCLICFLCGDGSFGSPWPHKYYKSVPVKLIEKIFLK